MDLVRRSAQQQSQATHKEGNENSRVHQTQGQDGSPAVSDPVGNGSGQENPDESTTLTGLEEGALPSGWNGPTGSINVDAEPFLKSGKGDKVGVQKHVERLHDLVVMGISGCSKNRSTNGAHSPDSRSGDLGPGVGPEYGEVDSQW